MYHHRKTYIRKSGGIAILVRQDLADSVNVLNFSDNEYVLWLKLHRSILGYSVIIGTVYIPPRSSKYSTEHEYDAIMKDLIDINIGYNECNICLVGDFNSRTGNLLDFVEPDEQLMHATGLEECKSELFIDKITLEKRIQEIRQNDDKVIDENGSKLVDFCIQTGFLIVKGRTGTDRNVGKVTCKGASTVDYVLGNVDLFRHIDAFHVELSDKCLSYIHCPLSLELIADIR